MQSFREHVLTLLPKGGTGAEIGVWQGDFSSRILEVAVPKHLHLIDPFEARKEPEYAGAWYGPESRTEMAAVRDGVVRRFAENMAKGQVTLHVARSGDVMPGFAPGSLDFVYIDGDHTYPSVRQDLAQSFRACRSGALICLDDYALRGWWKDGVVRATHEFLGEHAQACQIVLCHAGQLVIGKR
ncbi:MAG: class I SAM-dependent methyltransferase [Rhodobacter sp.]|nr:class I SAM-dependent methyltransferase [Rhodobacter sp.]